MTEYIPRVRDISDTLVMPKIRRRSCIPMVLSLISVVVGVLLILTAAGLYYHYL